MHPLEQVQVLCDEVVAQRFRHFHRYRAGLSACTDTGARSLWTSQMLPAFFSPTQTSRVVVNIAQVEIPITRWDISVYYCEDPDEAQAGHCTSWLLCLQ